MDITPFIRELIVQNECVILRGIGGFETSYKHATLDKKRKILIPPSKKINFRPDLIKDNGVLEYYLIENLEISNAKASAAIDDFVRWFFTTIKESGKVFLNGIGEFSFDKKNNIVFSDIENENYLAESFGLDTLVFENESGGNERGEETLKPVPVKKRKLTGWYVTIGILLLLVSVTTLILISNSKGISLFQWSDAGSKKSGKEEMIFGGTNKALEDSIIKSIEESLSESTIPKKALAVPQTQKSEPEIATNSYGARYYLVAGSFKSSKNADILKSQLERKGFSPEIMITGEYYYRVIVGAFSDRKEAVDELRRIRGQLDQSVWLFEDKNLN